MKPFIWLIFGPPLNFFKFDSPPPKKKAISVHFSIGDTIRINQEIQCLPYADFFTYKKQKSHNY